MNTLKDRSNYHEQMGALAIILMEQRLEAAGRAILVMWAIFKDDGLVGPTIKKMKENYDEGDFHSVMETVINVWGAMLDEKERDLQ